jgi:hypothetical protein
VRVARDRDFLAGVERGHHHALIAAGRAVDQEVGVLGAERVGREFLRLDERSLGLQEIVQPADLREVDRQHVVADEVAEGAFHPDALFVAGRVERDNAGVHIVQEHLEVRGARMIESGDGCRLGGTRDHNAGDYSTTEGVGVRSAIRILRCTALALPPSRARSRSASRSR